MKNKISYFLILAILALTTKAYAQNNIAAKTADDLLIEKANAAKTLTAWDVLGNLYQVAVNDVTATDKSISLKSTIYGFHKIFSKDINSAEQYKSLAWQRHIEPFINVNYLNRLDPSNLTLGATFSFVNANDATQAREFNSINNTFRDKQKRIDSLFIDPFIKELNEHSQSDDTTQRITLATGIDVITDQLTKFVITCDTTALSPYVKRRLKESGIMPEIISLREYINDLSDRIANRWNVTFKPQVTYAFNRSSFQGAAFTFNAIKGFRLIGKKTTQLVLESGYILGEDTIVTATNINRQHLLNKLGINQVFFTKNVKADDGSVNKTPSVELSVNYSYDRLLSGYLATEKQGQPALGAKLGFLIGKDNWLVFPFTYNFATSTSYASVSLKFNFGDAPFKSK